MSDDMQNTGLANRRHSEAGSPSSAKAIGAEGGHEKPGPDLTGALLAAVEEAAYRGTLRALREDGKFGENGETPAEIHRRHGHTPSSLAAAVDVSEKIIRRFETGTLKRFHAQHIAAAKRVAQELGEPEQDYIVAVQRWMRRKAG